MVFFFFSSRRRHTRCGRDWSSDVCSSDLKTTDGGTTWTEITHNPGLPTAGLIGKIGVSVSGADPNRVYALVEADGGGLFRSDDAGATWQLTTDDAEIRQRGFYFSKVFADPINPDR